MGPKNTEKLAQELPKMVPRGAEEGSKTIPNRKANEELHQDDHMAVLDPPGEGVPQFGATPG